MDRALFAWMSVFTNALCLVHPAQGWKPRVVKGEICSTSPKHSLWGRNLNTTVRSCSWKPGEAEWIVIFWVTWVPRAHLWHRYFHEWQDSARVSCMVSLGCSVPVCVCRWDNFSQPQVNQFITYIVWAGPACHHWNQTIPVLPAPPQRHQESPTPRVEGDLGQISHPTFALHIQSII